VSGTDERPTSAVVLSGGGADAAYGVGVLKALTSGASPTTGGQPLDPKIFAGTSAGAFNATYVAANWNRFGSSAVGNLERVWMDRLAAKPDGSNGLFRFLADPLTLSDPRSYLPNPLATLSQAARDFATLGWEGIQRGVALAAAGNEALRQRIIQTVNMDSFISREPFERIVREVIDYEALHLSDRIVRVIATNWLTGELHIFRRRDLSSSRLGPTAILASASVPGLFPPTSLGSQQFVDGGVLLNTPLKPALAAGARELHVIYLDPEVKNIGLNSLRSTVETLYRMNQITWAFAVNDDIEDARAINRGLELMACIDAGEPIDRSDGDILIRLAGNLLESGRAVTNYRPLTIHRYRPRDDTSGELGFLNLQPERLERLIDRGFQDASFHDCDESNCVLPKGGSSLSTDALDRAVQGFSGVATERRTS